jgi:23S rRNA pseudouridine1911/1915/1917 synthase
MNLFTVVLNEDVGLEHDFILKKGEKERLDIVLSQFLPELSRSRIKQLCQNGKACVNSEVRKASFKVQSGDRIEFEIVKSPLEDLEIKPENIPLDILYEDDDILVINKTSGLVVHPGAGIYSGTLVNALVFHFGQLTTRGGDLRPGIVHRLDKGTSGLLLVAKTDTAHFKLSQQWMNGKVPKVYPALVWGKPDPESGEIITMIGRHPKDRKRMTAEVEGGKRAHSRYKVTDSYPEASRLNVHILTGRTHQIRVHLLHLGFPVIGDALYGGNRHRHLKDAFPGMPDHPMLHAAMLRFQHPVTGEPLTFKIQPPVDFLACEQALKAWP